MTAQVRERSKETDGEVGEFFSIDEQMLAFWESYPLRLFVKNEPISIGVENFFLTTSNGTILDFERSQGSMTDLENKEFGIVLRTFFPALLSLDKLVESKIEESQRR